MANPDDLKLLDTGALDLSGCDLSNSDLSKRQLAGRDFSGANLNGSNAEGADFSGSNFSRASLLQLKADQANFSDAILSNLMLVNVSFIKSDLQNANLSSAHVQTCNFFEANLKGANFRSAQLIGQTILDAVKFDETTSFDGATGARPFSRLPVLAGYAYEKGRFRALNQGPQIASRAQEAFDASTFGSSFSIELADTTATVSAASSRLAASPQLFEDLARYAASQIRIELTQLEAKIPNEPGALEGYESVRNALQGLETGFNSLAEIVHSAAELPGPAEKGRLLATAVEAAHRMSEGFVSWLNENGTKAGRVIAELGLTGTIAGTLSYFVGVPPMISFPITLAAMNGKSVWDAIVLFAPNKPK